MFTFWLIMGIIAWLVVAFWPARVAQRKGYSFWGFFFLSIPFFFITIFVAYLMPERSRTTLAASVDE